MAIADTINIEYSEESFGTEWYISYDIYRPSTEEKRFMTMARFNADTEEEAITKFHHWASKMYGPKFYSLNQVYSRDHFSHDRITLADRMRSHGIHT